MLQNVLLDFVRDPSLLDKQREETNGALTEAKEKVFALERRLDDLDFLGRVLRLLRAGEVVTYSGGFGWKPPYWDFHRDKDGTLHFFVAGCAGLFQRLAVRPPPWGRRHPFRLGLRGPRGVSPENRVAGRRPPLRTRRAAGRSQARPLPRLRHAAARDGMVSRNLR